MAEIKYKLEDGEPVCNGIECPDHPGRGHKKCCFYVDRVGQDPDECVPGIRQQRDQAEDRLKWARDELINAQPHIAHGIERGEQCAKFLDAHIDAALDHCNKK